MRSLFFFMINYIFKFLVSDQKTRDEISLQSDMASLKKELKSPLAPKEVNSSHALEVNSFHAGNSGINQRPNMVYRGPFVFRPSAVEVPPVDIICRCRPAGTFVPFFMPGMDVNCPLPRGASRPAVDPVTLLRALRPRPGDKWKYGLTHWYTPLFRDSGLTRLEELSLIPEESALLSDAVAFEKTSICCKCFWVTRMFWAEDQLPISVEASFLINDVFSGYACDFTNLGECNCSPKKVSLRAYVKDLAVSVGLNQKV